MKVLAARQGDEREEMQGRRFVTAWRQTEKGERFYERELEFASWKELAGMLSPRRLQLLRSVRRHEGESIRALSKRLRRDYRNVYTEVQALRAAGMLEIREEGVWVEYDAVAVRITLGGPAR